MHVTLQTGLQQEGNTCRLQACQAVCTCRHKCRAGSLPQPGEAEDVMRAACSQGHILPSVAMLDALKLLGLRVEQTSS